MRSLLPPLLFALAGFGLLVYLTWPDAPAPRADADVESEAPSDAAEPRLRVSGRLVDADGAALAAETLALVAVDEGRTFALAVEPGRGGAFSAHGGADAPAGRVELRLWTRDAEGAVERFANLEAELGDGGATPTEVALGDVVLGTLPTLVRGIVRDADGGPVAGARLEVLEARHRGAGEPLEYVAARSPFPLDARTDGAGRFHVRGLPKAHALALHVDAGAEARAVPRPFAARDEALEVVLGPPGALAFDVELRGPDGPVDLGFARAWLLAWPAGAARSEELRPYVPTAEAGPTGRARFDALAPGDYDVSVHLASPENPAARVLPRARVAPGADGSDASPLAVELRVFHVRAVDPEGRELPARFEHRLPGTSTWLAATPTSADPDRPGVVSAWPALDLRVSAAGHEAVVLEAVDGDRAVTLTPRE